jgi:hypothetical protein
VSRAPDVEVMHPPGIRQAPEDPRRCRLPIFPEWAEEDASRAFGVQEAYRDCEAPSAPAGLSRGDREILLRLRSPRKQFREDKNRTGVAVSPLSYNMSCII